MFNGQHLGTQVRNGGGQAGIGHGRGRDGDGDRLRQVGAAKNNAGVGRWCRFGWRRRAVLAAAGPSADAAEAWARGIAIVAVGPRYGDPVEERTAQVRRDDPRMQAQGARSRRGCGRLRWPRWMRRKRTAGPRLSGFGRTTRRPPCILRPNAGGATTATVRWRSAWLIAGRARTGSSAWRARAGQTGSASPGALGATRRRFSRENGMPNTKTPSAAGAKHGLTLTRCGAPE